MSNEVKRYDEPLKVWFGGEILTVKRLAPIGAAAFAEAVAEQFRAMQDGDRSVDLGRLLKLGLPDSMTDELLVASTQKERSGLLVDLCSMHGLALLKAFGGDPVALFELSTKITGGLSL